MMVLTRIGRGTCTGNGNDKERMGGATIYYRIVDLIICYAGVWRWRGVEWGVWMMWWSDEMYLLNL